ncbi:hypothetical protein OHT52_10110 [Streptomyces sp. NBC_00247]|uniref:hypothetical protein n=1 Tax=Streptomyces sp. NBC_00247 TaxID=2975689 RepID=UPI002E286CA5|nr:hypothetical protein [Streptomyces sp. NBC_00247]
MRQGLPPASWAAPAGRFDEAVAGFWGDSEPRVQPPPTDEAVREAERALGVTLPPALLGLPAIRDGAVVADAYDTLRTGRPTSWGGDRSAPVAGRRSPVAGRRSPVAGRRSPVAGRGPGPWLPSA